MTKNDLRKSWKVIKNIIDKDQKIFKYRHHNFYLITGKFQTQLKLLIYLMIILQMLGAISQNILFLIEIHSPI